MAKREILLAKALGFMMLESGVKPVRIAQLGTIQVERSRAPLQNISNVDIAVDIVSTSCKEYVYIGGIQLLHEVGGGLSHSEPGGSYSGDEACG